jgi:hypothetical protein
MSFLQANKSLSVKEGRNPPPIGLLRIACAWQKGMLEKIAKHAALILLACFLLPSCSHFTQSGRQQLAYAKYVRKQSGIRQHQQAKFKKPRVPKAPANSPDQVATGVGESPQAVPRSESENQ